MSFWLRDFRRSRFGRSSLCFCFRLSFCVTFSRRFWVRMGGGDCGFGGLGG